MIDLLENFLTTPWFLVVVMASVFGWMLSDWGKTGFAIGATVGLIVMYVAETVPGGYALFALFLFLLGIGAYQKYKER